MDVRSISRGRKLALVVVLVVSPLSCRQTQLPPEQSATQPALEKRRLPEVVFGTISPDALGLMLMRHGTFYNGNGPATALDDAALAATMVQCYQPNKPIEIRITIMRPEEMSVAGLFRALTRLQYAALRSVGAEVQIRVDLRLIVHEQRRPATTERSDR